MYPETAVGASVAHQVRDGIAGGHVDAATANFGQVERQQLRGEELASIRCLLFCIAVAERHDILIVHQRATTLKVREEVLGPW